MRTVTTKLYSINELSEESKQKAIETERNSLYQYNDFGEWAIDNCYLFEPKHNELIKLFGNDFYEKLNIRKKYNDEPMIKNTRDRLYFSLDRDRYIDVSNAMQIENSDYFLKWLGLDEDLIEKVDYNILPDSIELLNQSDEDFTDDEQEVLDDAVMKFEDHCQEILNDIEKAIDFRFTDESITEDLECRELEYTFDGKPFNF